MRRVVECCIPSSVSSASMLFVLAVLEPSAETLRIVRPFFPRGAVAAMGKVNVEARVGESGL